MTGRDGVRLARGVWLPSVAATDRDARCLAALSVCAEDTVVSSTTAALLHGLWLPPVADDLHLAVTQPQRRAATMTRSQRPEFRAHRHRTSAQDRTVLRGIAVMSAARTWLDLARRLSLPDLVAAGDSALRGSATVEELDDVVRRSVHVPGVRRAREALLLLDPRSRSRPESHLRVAVSVAGLPSFEVNEPVYRRDGGWLAEPDLSLPEAKLALEYQGADHASLERMRRDITRARDLRSEGWLCLFYGPAEVFGRPWQIAPELRALIGSRAPQLLPPRRAPRRPTTLSG